MDQFEQVFGFSPVGGPVVGGIELAIVASVIALRKESETRERKVLADLEAKAKTTTDHAELYALLKTAKEQSQKASTAYAMWHSAVDLAKQANRYTESK